MRLGLGVGPMMWRRCCALPSMALQATTRTTWRRAADGHPGADRPGAAPGAARLARHDHWQALCSGAQAARRAAAGLFSVVIDARHSQEQVDAFCDGLRLFKIGYSWGGLMSPPGRAL